LYVGDCEGNNEDMNPPSYSDDGGMGGGTDLPTPSPTDYDGMGGDDSSYTDDMNPPSYSDDGGMGGDTDLPTPSPTDYDGMGGGTDLPTPTDGCFARDCNSECISKDTYDTWPGDNVCDSNMNCEEYAFDGGDCEGSSDGGRRRLAALPCYAAWSDCKENELCHGSVSDLYKLEKNLHELRLPVGVKCNQDGYHLLDFASSTMLRHGLGQDPAGAWARMIKLKNDAGELIDSTSAHSLLCRAYDECFGHYATTDFGYSLRFQSEQKFLNENYLLVKNLHCKNPFESRTKAQQAKVEEPSVISLFGGAERVSKDKSEPVRLKESYYECTSIVYQSPTTALGAAFTVAGGGAASVIG
jgi:hypothetical protein